MRLDSALRIQLEKFVKAFLLLDPEYATKISDVWIHHEVPSAIRKKLHLPNSDQGIDLIAKTNRADRNACRQKYFANFQHFTSLKTFSHQIFLMPGRQPTGRQ
ncbi:MAG: hypothetical protein EBV58_07065 [Actinobacteria bacterium]|nr:hypothetical protein [Actinomycetota bacterium]